MSTYDREYYQRNREKIKARSVEWREDNPERFKEICKNYYRRHKSRSTHYYTKNKARIKAQTSEWQKKNPDKRRTYKAKRRTAKSKAGGSFTAAQWLALCAKYHYRCVCCGKRRKLTTDHVIPVSKGGSSNIKNIQPLCLPCNSHKGTKTTDYR